MFLEGLLICGANSTSEQDMLQGRSYTYTAMGGHMLRSCIMKQALAAAMLVA